MRAASEVDAARKKTWATKTARYVSRTCAVIVNQPSSRTKGWRVLRKRQPLVRDEGWLTITAQVLLTYLAVLVAQVFFRAASTSDAARILAYAIGANGVGLPGQLAPYLGHVLPASVFSVDPLSVVTYETGVRVALGFLIVWFTPNSQQILGK